MAGEIAGAEFDYLGTVKTLCGVTGDKEDGLLNAVLDMTRRSVMNYCNISEIPPALNHLVCAMACDAYREARGKSSAGEVVGNVSSVSEGGRSVSFSSLAEMSAGLDDKVSKTRELQRYRKLYRL